MAGEQLDKSAVRTPWSVTPWVRDVHRITTPGVSSAPSGTVLSSSLRHPERSVLEMGQNSRSRRAAKQKKRARNAAQRPAGARSGAGRAAHGAASGPGSEPLFTAEEMIAGLIDLAPARRRQGDEQFVSEAIDRLVDFPARDVRAAVAAELRRTMAAMWDGGWQPVEIVRQARRSSVAAASLATAAIAADHAGRSSSTIDHAWAEQLDALSLPTVADANGDAWVAEWARSARLDRSAELQVVFDLLVVLRALPRVAMLIDPPGGSATNRPRAAASVTNDVDRAVLDKVRSLLVKAESTTFEAEAEAFTAKAHELMTRHAIDTAILDADDAGATRSSDDPITVRIAIDDPYVDAKSLLLQEVAQASRCRSVFHDGLAMSSVVGYPADIAATEMLYTSLLVQAQSAIAAEARRAEAGSRARSRGFRSAFLLSFATRIGQRLSEVNDSLVAEADTDSGGAVLLVLRDRQSIVDDSMDQQFGEMRSHSVRGGTDAAGWVSGRHAADQARLNFGDLESA